MRIGTKSVLFGAHTFWLHPWFVALAWWKLYGFRPVVIRRSLVNPPGITTSLWDPRLWLAFFVHDIGYLGKPNMDGPEGEGHPQVGARIMYRLFGAPWEDLVLYHSRYLAKRDGRRYSVLCVADKLAIALTPAWLYLPLVHLSGEIEEYMGKARERHSDMSIDLSSPRAWYAGVQDYCRRWAYEHRDGRQDSWTAVRQRENVGGAP